MGQVVDGTGGQRSGVGAGGLDTTNAMLRSVIDGIADPVYAKDAEGRYLLVNPAAASAAGLRPDQVLGYTDAELLPGPVAARLQAADRWVMASELPSRSREELVSPEGPRVDQALKAPWGDAGGRIAGVVGVSRDVTGEERADRDRRRLLARLHDIQEEWGRIAVGLDDGRCRAWPPSASSWPGPGRCWPPATPGPPRSSCGWSRRRPARCGWPSATTAATSTRPG